MKTQFIDERVVRHIARKHYDMTYAQESVMEKKNKGEITWWPIVFANIMALFFVILPFMFDGKNKMIASMFSVGFCPAFLYGAIALSIQEYRHNKWWKEIRHKIIKFKRMIECPIDSSPPWDELLERAKYTLEKKGEAIVHANALAALMQQRIHQARCALGLETGEEGSFMREHQMFELEQAFDETNQKFKESKKSFEELFQLAKYILGKPLDDGHGYGPFMRRIEASVKEHRQ